MGTNLSIPEDLLLLDVAGALRPLVAEGLANDLPGFVKEAWRILHPGRPLIWSWHYDYLCELLVLVKRRVVRRLIINVPPRTLKSTLVTIIYLVWVWLTDPGHHFLTASYSMDLSVEHSIRRRNLLQSAWLQGLWGDKFQLSGGFNQVGHFMNNRGGQMIATSVGATAMGRGCDTAILDDPVSADQVLSDSQRMSTNNWIGTTLLNRLNDPRTGAVILLGQRLHQQDPTGFLLEQERGVWTHACIPLVAEEDTDFVFPISGRVVQRKNGDILMPERFSPAVVEQYRSRRMVFAGQYQQRPAPLDGNLIKCSDVRYYGIDPKAGQPDERLPENFDLKLISVDCAFKDLANSDYTVILVVGVKRRKRFTLEVVNKHLDVAAIEAEIRRLRDKHRPINVVLVEDKANGPAVVQRLKTEIPGVLEVNPKGGKLARMVAAAPEWQAGDWYVSRNAPWTEPFVDQLTMFPADRHDDMVDAMTQAACWLGTYQFPTVVSRNAMTGELNWSFNSGDLASL